MPLPIRWQMDRRLKQASAYLDPETYAAFAALSGQHQRSISGHLKHLIEREIARDDVTKSLVETQIKILIGVDGLLKYHDNNELFGIVKATRNSRLGSAPDEA